MIEFENSQKPLLSRRLVVYYKKPPPKDRYIKWDHHFIDLLRLLIRGKPKMSSTEKVFLNLLKGFDLLKVPYNVNIPFNKLEPDDMLIFLGVGRYCLKGYDKANKIIAGIALMTHPSEWPDLCENYPVEKYLQHSEWANNIYKPFYGEKCDIWPVGIDSEKWKPSTNIKKEYDFLIYNKITWNKDARRVDLLDPIKELLAYNKFTFKEIAYGQYESEYYFDILQKCEGMIFLTEHESQGIAYQECLSMNVPIFAWDQGKLIDPNYQFWGDEEMPATSVPYFDERCGMKFKDFNEFENLVPIFVEKLNGHSFSPRKYIIENLTLEKSAKMMVKIINDVYGS